MPGARCVILLDRIHRPGLITEQELRNTCRHPAVADAIDAHGELDDIMEKLLPWSPDDMREVRRALLSYAGLNDENPAADDDIDQPAPTL